MSRELALTRFAPQPHSAFAISAAKSAEAEHAEEGEGETADEGADECRLAEQVSECFRRYGHCELSSLLVGGITLPFEQLAHASKNTCHSPASAIASGCYMRHYKKPQVHILAFVCKAAGSTCLRTTNDKKDYADGKAKRDTAATHRTPADAEKAWSEKVADPS